MIKLSRMDHGARMGGQLFDPYGKLKEEPDMRIVREGDLKVPVGLLRLRSAELNRLNWKL